MIDNYHPWVTLHLLGEGGGKRVRAGGDGGYQESKAMQARMSPQRWTQCAQGLRWLPQGPQYIHMASSLFFMEFLSKKINVSLILIPSLGLIIFCWFILFKFDVIVFVLFYYVLFHYI